MKLALIGYGKMGKIIEETALRRGHDIVLKIDIDNLADFTEANLRKADAAIEFTGPHSAYDNALKIISFGVPLVCGSTGWTDKLDAVLTACDEHNGSFIYASNFSVGVNIFFEINNKLAALMARHPEYEPIIEEIHHTQKKDAPSGTAITLARQILKFSHQKKRWVNEVSENPEDLEIISQRIDPTPGTHSVKYSSAVDDIEIIHTAHNRKGFALGAVLAAEFIKDKKGIFTMQDVLNFY
jgi:4-hydroxy-tetrahydrodipicolinate reductase